MDKNNQDKTTATENKLWLPPLSPKDQKRLKPLQKKSLTERMGFAGKTPWDLIQLLLIPIVLAAVTFGFGLEQSRISDTNSQRQHETDMQLAADQQRETTLKTYLDDMSDLLLNHHLRTSKPEDEVSQVAKARTLTALRRLDATRNGIVLQFLQDTHLINSIDAAGNSVVPIIDLSGADLSGADLRGVNLNSVNLFHADLSGANLSGTILDRANLIEADLDSTDLSGASLGLASLGLASLSRANLDGADLFFASLFQANLSGATLSGATLSNADLSGAKVTQTQLNEAKSLQGTIMPDGSKHP